MTETTWELWVDTASYSLSPLVWRRICWVPPQPATSTPRQIRAPTTRILFTSPPIHRWGARRSSAQRACDLQGLALGHVALDPDDRPAVVEGQRVRRESHGVGVRVAV